MPLGGQQACPSLYCGIERESPRSESLDSNPSPASYKQRHSVFSKARLLLRDGDNKIHPDQKKILKCPKLKAGGRKEETREVNPLTTTGQNQQKTTYTPECVLKLCINLQGISQIIKRK